MAKSAAPAAAARSVELKKQAAKLVITAFLVILGVAALVVPNWGMGLGSFLGGCNEATYTLSAADGSELDADAQKSAEDTLTKRAQSLYELGVSCGHNSEGNFILTAPQSVDVQTLAESIVGTGHVDFVSQLDISNADDLEKIQNGSSDITLSSDSYTAFMTNANVAAAHVVNVSSNDTTSYAVQISLDEDATTAFAEKTEELASSYGVIAVVVDGQVVATPYVSEKIESSEVTISGGFDRAQAYALAAKFNSGELEAGAAVASVATYGAAFDGAAPLIAAVAALVVAVVAGFVSAHFFGKSGWTVCASLVVTLAVTLGLMSLLGQLDLLILARYALYGLALVAALNVAASVVLAYRYNLARKGGSSVRKSQELAAADHKTIERIYLIAGIVALVAALLCERHIAQILWVVGAGLIAEFILSTLFKLPVLCVITASDKVAAERSEVQDAELAQQGENASADTGAQVAE